MPITNIQSNNTIDQFRLAFNDAANAINTLSGGGTAVLATSFAANNLTFGRVAIVGTAGLIQDDAGLTYDPTTDVLTLSGTTDSINPGTGTLIVSGGVGIGKNLHVSGNTFISGNLTVLGSTTEFSTTQIEVNDPLLQLANNNTSDLIDIGIFGQYNQGAANLHTGLFRDSLDDTWKLFKSYSAEPTTKISTSANNFAYADLSISSLIANANGSFAGTLTVTGNTSLGNLNVNTNKFNIISSSGNTTIAGTLNVSNAVTLANTLTVTGNTSLGNLNVNTNKFNIISSSGNTTIAGTLNVSNAVTLANTLTVTNPIGVSSGGTGAASFAANTVLLGNGTSALQTISPGSSGNVLISNGTTWQSTALSTALPGFPDFILITQGII